MWDIEIWLSNDTEKPMQLSHLKQRIPDPWLLGFSYLVVCPVTLDQFYL